MRPDLIVWFVAAGTCSIVYRDGQARSNWPADGVRYAQPNESVARQAVTLPSGQQVEIETSMIAQGIFPPSNPNVPLSQDTPELILGRYRLRYRVITPGVGNPNLYLVYWGRDPNSNARCPAGWERECIRRYPLPNFPSQPLYPLKMPTPAAASGQQPNNQLSAAAIAQQQNLMQQRMLQSAAAAAAAQANQGRPGTGQAQIPPAAGATHMPNGVVVNGAANLQYIRPSGAPQQVPGAAGMQQIPANVAPALAAQYAAQQRQLQMQAAAMAARNAAGSNAAGGQPGRPVTGNMPAMLTMQQQAQAQAAAIVTQQQVQQIAQIRALVSNFPFPMPFNDDYEALSDRTRAGMRYETNHKLIAPIFDAFTTTDLLTTWKEPPQVDLEGVKAQIKALEADIVKLRAKSNPTATSDSADLLAPLPKLMPIAQMREAALQADALRRAAVDQAQQAAEEEAKQRREAEDARLAAAQAAERQRQMDEMKKEQMQYINDTMNNSNSQNDMTNGLSADTGRAPTAYTVLQSAPAQPSQTTAAPPATQQAVPLGVSRQDSGFQQTPSLEDLGGDAQARPTNPESASVPIQNGAPPAMPTSDGAAPAPDTVAHNKLQVNGAQPEIPSNNGSQFGEGDDSFLFNDNFGNYDGNQFEETIFDELEYLTQMQE